MMKPAELTLTKEWDKTFPKSDKVDHSKVTFINRYGYEKIIDSSFINTIAHDLPFCL